MPPDIEGRREAMPDADLELGPGPGPSPEGEAPRARPRLDLGEWLLLYLSATEGVEGGCDEMVRRDPGGGPGPGLYLRVLRPAGAGPPRPAGGDGAPRPPGLVAEVTESSARDDLRARLDAHRGAGVRESIVWRLLDGEVEWSVLGEDGRFVPLVPATDGILRSRAFPGLWLHVRALVDGDVAGVAGALRMGLESPEHAAFEAELRGREVPRLAALAERGDAPSTTLSRRAPLSTPRSSQRIRGRGRARHADTEGAPASPPPSRDGLGLGDSGRAASARTPTRPAPGRRSRRHGLGAALLVCLPFAALAASLVIATPEAAAPEPSSALRAGSTTSARPSTGRQARPSAEPFRAPALAVEPGAAAGDIVGIVTATDGGPLPGVRLVLATGADLAAAAETASGADGRFAFRGVAPGTYAVIARSPSHLPAAPATVRAAAGGENHLRLSLEAGLTIAGSVGGPGGEPLPARVEARLLFAAIEGKDARRTAALERVVETGADGRFVVEGLAPGTYALEAVPLARGLAASAIEAVVAGSDEVRIVAGFGSVAGETGRDDAAGAPLPQGLPGADEER